MDDGKLGLRPDLFDNDAWIMKDIRSAQVQLKNKRGDFQLEMQIGEFPYLGLWSPPAAPFVCIEPWCGVNDTVAHDGTLENKAGTVKLEPDQLFRRSWSARV